MWDFKLTFKEILSRSDLICFTATYKRLHSRKSKLFSLGLTQMKNKIAIYTSFLLSHGQKTKHQCSLNTNEHFKFF